MKMKSLQVNSEWQRKNISRKTICEKSRSLTKKADKSGTKTEK